MEIVKNRYGLDRMVEKIAVDKIRVTGESQFQRINRKSSGKIRTFDFEGGPSFSVGSNLSYQGVDWTVLSIQQLDGKHEGLVDCLLTVKMVW